MAATDSLGRPDYLLEKDLWVVWLLRTMFESPLGSHLTFKGGTSLSKVFRLIDRFSEDIDLTCDIRHLIPELASDQQLPSSGNQARKWSEQVRAKLPGWVQSQVVPVIADAITREGLSATIAVEGANLFVHYVPLTPVGGYIKPVVLLEFGARSSGEPHSPHQVYCDMAEALPELVFPQALPLVMDVSRTFWEKATAAHVFCAQNKLKGERFARHWHDLAAIARSPHFSSIAANTEVAALVAAHKGWFFREHDVSGNLIDYRVAVAGGLCIVPEGAARAALAKDYANMLDGGMLFSEPLAFDELMGECEQLQGYLNLQAA
ncbi:MAG: nucleotidyl transferase AbiEii/AbiGii toxin family protein [Pseudomonas sp.]